MSNAPQPLQNHLLLALPPETRERVFPNLELVALPQGQTLYESGDGMQDLYFPTDSIVSPLYVLADGVPAEVAVVGNEGMVGVVLFVGDESTLSRVVVQSAGHAYRLKGAVLAREFSRDEALHVLLLRYAQALLMQMAQTLTCNRDHSVDQRLGRWLLLSLDRLPSNTLTLTQGLLARMFGVRRDDVAEAAAKLHTRGLIEYRADSIVVPDRVKLERGGCDCYTLVKAEFDRLLPRRAEIGQQTVTH